MMDNGIGMDFISLSQPPLHIVPLFFEKLSDKVKIGNTDNGAINPQGHYEVPHWVNLQYVNVDEAIFENTKLLSKSMKNYKNLSDKLQNHPVLLSDGNIQTKQRKFGRGLENYSKVGSSLPLYTTENFSFSPFPFGQILQKHADSLTALEPLKKEADSVSISADEEELGAEVMVSGNGGINRLHDRASIIMRLLSLPRALENLLGLSDKGNCLNSSESKVVDSCTKQTLSTATWGDIAFSDRESIFFKSSQRSKLYAASLTEPSPSPTDDGEVFDNKKKDIIAEEINGLSGKVPQIVLDSPEYLLEYLASPEVDNISSSSVMTLMKYYDKKVGPRAFETSIPPLTSPPKTMKSLSTLPSRLERKVSSDDINIGKTANKTSKSPSMRPVSNNMSSTFTDLASSRHESFKKPNQYNSNVSFDNDRTTGESSLSIVPDVHGGTCAKVMVRYPDGSGRTYRAYTPATPTDTCAKSSAKSTSPDRLLSVLSHSNSNNTLRGEVNASQKKSHDSQPISSVNSRPTEGGFLSSTLSYLAGINTNTTSSGQTSTRTNPSLLTSPLISRASRGNRRQLGEVVQNKRAAEGGFTVTMGSRERKVRTDSKLQMNKIDNTVRRDPPPPLPPASAAVLPVVQRTEPIAIPSATSMPVHDNSRMSGCESIIGDLPDSGSIEKVCPTKKLEQLKHANSPPGEVKHLAASLNNIDAPLLVTRPRADSSRTNPQTSALVSASPTKTLSNSFEVEVLRDRRKTSNLTSLAPSFATDPISSKIVSRKFSINPFRLEEGEVLMRMRTHNRRRWAHALPRYQHMDAKSKWELNWKSLCQPVVLPLTTDFLPSLDEIRTQYTEANYSLLLEKSVCPYTKPETLLAEMVNQRLAQEFQVIENDSQNFRIYKKLVTGAADKDVPDQFFLILSMGHRIHFLCYTPSRETINVYRYMSRVGTNDSNSAVTYRYRIWSKQFQRFVVMQQNFYQYPEPEHAWNLTDEVLLGNQDILSENSRAKRIRFAVVPCNGVTSEVYQENFEKLITFLNKYCAETFSLKFHDDDVSPSNVTHKKNLNCKFWLRRPSGQHDRPQWAYLRCEDSYSMRKVFHLEIYWIVCVASLMDDFVNMLFRRCGSWGLRLIQIPEFFCVANLQMHPFRGNPQILVPKLPSLIYRVPNDETVNLKQVEQGSCIQTDSISADIISRDYVSPTQLMERILLQSASRYNKYTLQSEANDWIPDDKQRTNWEAMGLSEPECHLKDNCPNILIKKMQSNMGSSLMSDLNRHSLRVSKLDNGKLDSSNGGDDMKSNSILSDKLKSLTTYATQTLQTASEKLGVGQSLVFSSDSSNDQFQTICEPPSRTKAIYEKSSSSATMPIIENNIKSELPSTLGGSLEDITSASSSYDELMSSPQSPLRKHTHSFGSPPHSLSAGASTLLSTSPSRRSKLPPFPSSNAEMSPQTRDNSKSVDESHSISQLNSVSPPIHQSQGLSEGERSNHVPSYRPRLRRHIHYDNQYMQLMGYAVVRVAARGFIWLQSSTPRVSDVERLGLDEKRNMSEKILVDFGEQCRSVRLCYEVLIECIEEAMCLSEFVSPSNTS